LAITYGRLRQRLDLAREPRFDPNSATVNRQDLIYQKNFYFSLKEPIMDFDFRLLIVLAPLAIAGGWAVYTILPYALKQIQGLLGEKN
jgi:photosystem II PsbY protein